MVDTTYSYDLPGDGLSEGGPNGTSTGTVSGTFSADYNTDTASGTLTVTTTEGVNDTINFTNANISDGAGDPTQFTVHATAPNGDILNFTYDTMNPTTIDGGGFQNVHPAPGTMSAEYAFNSGDAIQSTNTTACYVTGTLIRTIYGDVAVEDLRIGDYVVTASGAERPIKWIGNRGYAGRFANTNPDALPICFKAGSLADNVPSRDLWVSPKHAMFLDNALFPAEVLVNGFNVVKAERVDSVTYWHVELASHDVLIAEGALSESYVDDNSRGMFQNAYTFAAMYPNDATPVAAVYCAPRIEDGHQLEAVRQALAARAGIATDVPDCGALNGYIDAMDSQVVRGWVRSALNPAMPVCLDLVVDGLVVAQALANLPRADLAAGGYGPHAFEIALPADVAGKSVQVRRSADGTALKMVLSRAA